MEKIILYLPQRDFKSLVPIIYNITVPTYITTRILYITIEYIVGLGGWKENIQE